MQPISCARSLFVSTFKKKILEKGHVLHMATPLGEPRPIMGVWGESGAEPIHACETAKTP